MSFAIAAYLVTVGTLGAYGWLLARERARLERESRHERDG